MLCHTQISLVHECLMIYIIHKSLPCVLFGLGLVQRCTNFESGCLQVVSHHWLIIALILWPTQMDHVQTLTVHVHQTECWVKCEAVTPGEIL